MHFGTWELCRQVRINLEVTKSTMTGQGCRWQPNGLPPGACLRHRWRRTADDGYSSFLSNADNSTQTGVLRLSHGHVYARHIRHPRRFRRTSIQVPHFISTSEHQATSRSGDVRGQRASMATQAVTNQDPERRVGRSPGVDPTATELAGGMTKYRCPFSSGRCA